MENSQKNQIPVIIKFNTTYILMSLLFADFGAFLLKVLSIDAGIKFKNAYVIDLLS